jgi:hypothetical protein
MDARKTVLESAITLDLFTGFFCSAALRSCLDRRFIFGSELIRLH